MWLTYGVDDHGSLVAVDDAPHGKTALHCPSCAGPLTAKKGQVVGHHFAHTGETCRALDRADDAIALPLYDQFHLQLSGKELQLLRDLWAAYGAGTVYPPSKERRLTQRLEARGVLAWNAYQRRGRGGYEITKLGKIPVGALSLRLFTEVQEPLLHEKHAQELRAVAGKVTIRVLDSWPQRGNVELYFKHRYHAEQRRLGSFTEYFAFADVRPVLGDLRRMPLKGLTPLEQAVLADVPTVIEQELSAEAEARAGAESPRTVGGDRSGHGRSSPTRCPRGPASWW